MLQRFALPRPVAHTAARPLRHPEPPVYHPPAGAGRAPSPSPVRPVRLPRRLNARYLAPTPHRHAACASTSPPRHVRKSGAELPAVQAQVEPRHIVCDDRSAPLTDIKDHSLAHRHPTTRSHPRPQGVRPLAAALPRLPASSLLGVASPSTLQTDRDRLAARLQTMGAKGERVAPLAWASRGDAGAGPRWRSPRLFSRQVRTELSRSVRCPPKRDGRRPGLLPPPNRPTRWAGRFPKPVPCRSGGAPWCCGR